MKRLTKLSSASRKKRSGRKSKICWMLRHINENLRSRSLSGRKKRGCGGRKATEEVKLSRSKCSKKSLR